MISLGTNHYLLKCFPVDTDWPLKGASMEAGREEAEVTTEAQLADWLKFAEQRQDQDE